MSCAIGWYARVCRMQSDVVVEDSARGLAARFVPRPEAQLSLHEGPIANLMRSFAIPYALANQEAA